MNSSERNIDILEHILKYCHEIFIHKHTSVILVKFSRLILFTEMPSPYVSSKLESYQVT